MISGLGWEERNMELVEAALSGRKTLNVHEVKNNVEISEQAEVSKRCNF